MVGAAFFLKSKEGALFGGGDLGFKKKEQSPQIQIQLLTTEYEKFIDIPTLMYKYSKCQKYYTKSPALPNIHTHTPTHAQRPLVGGRQTPSSGSPRIKKNASKK